MKKKYIYLSFIILVLLAVATITMTYAWVNDTKKSKISAEDLIVSESDQLLISIKTKNGEKVYSSAINANSDSDSDYAAILNELSLKDFTGDGVNLYSPTVDPYTKKPLSTGWSVIRTDQGDSQVIAGLNKKSENITYLSMTINFLSNEELAIFLSPNSYVLPANTGITDEYVMFLKRVATCDLDDDNKVTYKYYTENGEITVTDESKLPKVYNQSLYCSSSFDNSIDQEVFDASSATSGTITNTQTIYSANYVCSTVRVAFIDETKTADYRTIQAKAESTVQADKDSVTGTDYHTNYDNCKLRLLWSPNPTFQGTDTYNAETSSHKYTFDIVSNNTRTYEEESAYYMCDNTSLVQTSVLHFPKDLFVTNLTDSEELVSNYYNTWDNARRATENKPHTLVTLKENSEGKYEGSIKVILWIEGTDPDAMVALTAGNGAGVESKSGTAKIRFQFAFFGENVAMLNTSN